MNTNLNETKLMLIKHSYGYFLVMVSLSSK